MKPFQPDSPPPAAPETSGAVIAPAYQPAPQPGAVITHQGTSAEPGKAPKRTARGEGRDIGRPGKLVSAANRWRENYNALVGMTIARAVEHLNMLQRGDTAYPQWAFRLMERRFPTLSALLSCCEEPLATFDWHIKINATMPPGMTAEQHEAMAAAQKATLEEAYNRIDNLRGAITHLHLANFRGYAHLQKHRDAEGNVFHLEPLDQWCVCRDGLWGNWFWNPDSKTTSAPLQFLGEAFAIGGPSLPLEDFVIFERPRPIDEMALFLFIRANLCEKDWDAFLEVYGLPSGVVTLPNGIPPEKVSSYEAAASAIAEGGSGALPFGSSYSPNDSPRGTDPFTPRLRWLSEQVVLVGTGGKLTMLTESGSGTLAGGAQADTFTAITHGRCRAISEAMQQQFDREILAAKHPGEPVLVYFDFGAEEGEDMAALVGTITSLAAAGYRTRAEQVAEKTGLQIEETPEAGGQSPEEGKGPDGEDGEAEEDAAPDDDAPETPPDDGDADPDEDEITNRDGFVTIDGHVVFVGPDKDETDGGSREGGDRETHGHHGMSVPRKKKGAAWKAREKQAASAKAEMMKAAGDFLKAPSDAAYSKAMQHIARVRSITDKYSGSVFTDAGFAASTMHNAVVAHGIKHRIKAAISNRSAPTPSPAAALAGQLAPLGKRLEAIAQIADPATRREFLAKLLADFPAIRQAIGADESFAQTVEPQVVKDFLAGLRL